MGQTIKELAEESAEAARLYIQAETDLLKLKSAKWLAKFATHITLFFVFALTIILILIFLGMSLAMALQTWFSASVSFLLVSCLFMVCGLLFFALRNHFIGNNVLKAILKEIFDEPQV